MFYTYKNSKILLNGNSLITKDASLNVSSSNDPIYEVENKNRLGYAPANGIGGSLRFSYYLTYRDYLKNYIENDSSPISGYFGGLYFSSGYLKSHSINFTPNTPVIVNSEIVFFDELKGKFNPSYETAIETGFFHFSQASINNASTKVGERITNIKNADFNYLAEIQPLYLSENILPERIVFGQKETQINISTDQLDGDIPIYGKNSIVSLRVVHPTNTGIYENYDCQGILYQRDINSSVGQMIESNLSIKSQTVDKPPIIFSFNPYYGKRDDNVNIYGANFTSSSKVYFRNIEATGIISSSANTIIVKAPYNGETGPITVENNNASFCSDINFTYTGKQSNIFSINPISAPVGEIIDISGENFYDISEVKFSSNIIADFIIVNSNKIQTVVPNEANWGRISIYNNSLNNISYSPFEFVPNPIIDSFSPISGISGAIISITGHSFSGITGLLFNNLPNVSPYTTNFKVVNNNLITGMVPSGNAFGYIRIIGQSGVYARSSQEFEASVAITGITPLSGRTGSLVYLLGTNFETSLMFPTGNKFLVDFNGASAAFYRTSFTGLTGLVPSRANSGIVSIYKKDGVGLSPSNVLFSLIYEPPVITSFYPISGKRNNLISVIGENFFNLRTSGVRLINNGITYTGTGITTSQNGNQLSFYINNNTSGNNYSVVVFTDYGSGSGNNFRVLENPIISGFYPRSGFNGQIINISGLNLYPYSKIFIENTGIEASVISGSSSFNNLTFSIPATMSSSGRIIIYNEVGFSSGNQYLTKFSYPSSSSLLIPNTGMWGASIILSGSGFYGITGVGIGTGNLVSFLQTSGTGISFNIPVNSNSDYINLFLPGNNIVNTTQYLSITPNLVTFSGFNPRSGYVGDSVNISGTYTNTYLSVLFSGDNNVIIQNNFSIIDNSRIITTVPPGARSGVLGIRNIAGDTFSIDKYNVIKSPIITSLQNPYGAYKSYINVYGEGLAGATYKFQGHNNFLIDPISVSPQSDFHAVLQVPKEIKTGPIYVFNNSLSGKSQNFIPIPTISGYRQETIISGRSIIITGINAVEASVYIGVSGEYNNYLLNNILAINKNTSSIDGAGILNAVTGRTIFASLINSEFLGTGRPYLIPSGYDIDTYFNLFNQNSGDSNIDTVTFGSQLGAPITVLREPPQITGFLSRKCGTGTLINITGHYLLNANVFVTTNNGLQSGFCEIVDNAENYINFYAYTGISVGNSGYVGVNTRHGYSGVATSGYGYLTYINHPYLSGFNPISGIAGENILLTGFNLNSVTGVYFNNSIAEYVSGSNILAKVPFVGTSYYSGITVSVFNEAGISSKYGFYLVPQAPNIVYTTGNQSITGHKIFYSKMGVPVISGLGNTGYMVDTNNRKALDWNNRSLTNDLGRTTVDWNGEALINSSGAILDWENGIITNYELGGSTKTSIDWKNRLLKSVSTLTTLDWENYKLYDNNGGEAITFGNNYQFYKGLSGRWLAEILKVNYGLYTSGIHDPLGFSSVDLGQGKLFDPDTSIHTLDWISQTLIENNTNTVTLDWRNKGLSEGWNIPGYVTTGQTGGFGGSNHGDGINLSGNLLATGKKLWDFNSNLSGNLIQTGITIAANFVDKINNQFITGSKNFITSISSPTISGSPTQGIMINNNGATIIDWYNSVLQDNNAAQSLYWNSRLLKSSTNITVLDWQNYILNDNNGSTAISFSNTNLKGLSGKWLAQILTIDKTFYSSGIHDPQNFSYIDLGQGKLVNPDTSVATLDWVNGLLYDNSNNNTLNWDTRNLIGNWTIPGYVTTGQTGSFGSSRNYDDGLNLSGNLLATGTKLWNFVTQLSGNIINSGKNIPNFIITGSGKANCFAKFINDSGIISGELYELNNNIGINNVSPIAKLDVYGVPSQSSALRVSLPVGNNQANRTGIYVNITNGGSNATTYGCYLNVANSSSNYSLYIQTGKALINDSLDMNYNSLLRVGNTNIGSTKTTSVASLQVNDFSTYGGGDIIFGGDDRGQGEAFAIFAGIKGIKENNTYLDHKGALVFSTSTGGVGPSRGVKNDIAEGMRLSSAGNLGINNTSPVSKLDVSGQILASGGNFTKYLTLSGVSVTTGGPYQPLGTSLSISLTGVAQYITHPIYGNSGIHTRFLSGIGSNLFIFNGNDIVADLGLRALNGNEGEASINWGSREMINSSVIKVVDWEAGQLTHPTEESVDLDWNTRQLTGPWTLNGSLITNQGLLNTGMLGSRVFKSSKVDFKNTGNHSIYTVDSNMLFMVDTMEVITTDITSPSAAPYIKFGNTSNTSAYTSLTQSISNSQYGRHVFDNPQDAISAGTTITATIATASTAAIHSGFFIYKGYIIPNN